MTEMYSSRAHDMPPQGFGLYLHFPFCRRRCSYCDFFVVTDAGDGVYAPYIEALLTEARDARAWLDTQGMVPLLRSIFIGGGTPSLCPPPLLTKLFEELEILFPRSPDCEITLEANPETITLEKCIEWKQGIPLNRVSLGAQSFSPRHLKSLEREATPQQVTHAVACLKSVGYSNLNLDFIFGIPEQTWLELEFDLKSALNLEVTHLSAYNLTLKEGHPLYPHLPSDELTADLYESAIAFLESNGLHQYEISNYSKPDFTSKHNELYWDGGDFLGLGPSAASRFFKEGQFVHGKNSPDLKAYLADPRFRADRLEKNTPSQTVLEAIFLEIRKNSGIALAQFSHRYGKDLRQARKYQSFIDGGLIAEELGVLRLSPRGRLLADTVARDLSDF